ncbi:MAG: pyruvate kinase [Actinomycetales bacterium]|nr:pyruvate kinase [Actinomycetales bacterium]
MRDRVSTGLTGFDRVIDDLRLGDNVVWQVDSILDYRRMVDPYVARAKAEGRRLVYVRFGDHEPVVDDDPRVVVHRADPTQGFEHFATEVHNLVAGEGKRAFYVFDRLTDLLPYWYSDLMIGNFFKVTCPFLYELDTIAYFAISRNAHTHQTVATIRETTQLLLDLYRVDDRLYVHPLKVWQRYSPTMFFPHHVRGDEAVCITASSEAAELFTSIQRRSDRPDNWTVAFGQARDALSGSPEEQEPVKLSLMRMIIGRPSRMFDLCARYLTLADVLTIASREIGTGFVGGKSVGMLLARKILDRDGGDRLAGLVEPHDSFYIGADVFYTYIVQNGWWRLRVSQRTPEGFYAQAPELREKLLAGTFPGHIREQFVEMLEYFGQSPIIVRSSSLLEDGFGNAFAGKYESIFCVNQGSPEERYEAFENAVRRVYASTMDQDALDYRMDRGLADRDEQMAILVQRVSGDQHEDDFFPHVAGVGNSANLYLWDPDIDAEAGMLRLVFGLGTRAVDRTVGDYARIVCLDDPLRLPPTTYGDEKKFSQRRVDVLSLTQNAWTTRRLEEVLPYDLKTDTSFFASVDRQAVERMREMGRRLVGTPRVLDFRRLLGDTEFPGLMREVLTLLSTVYEYPVDVEFTANIYSGSDLRVNILQCRPLQTRGLGRPVAMPEPADTGDCLLWARGNFMGGNVRIPLDHIVYVRPLEYLRLGEQAKHAVARRIGVLNAALRGRAVMLLGPGRWGTSTPSLGVPVRFAELSNMAVIGEIASRDAGFMPELSYGSHMFQDLVEAGIFYVAVFDGEEDVAFHPDRILGLPNLAASLAPGEDGLDDVVHVVDATGIEVFSDITTQTVLCR